LLATLDDILAQDAGDGLGVLYGLGNAGVGRIEGSLLAELVADLDLRSRQNRCVAW
jgi:hypothetical protein